MIADNCSDIWASICLMRSSIARSDVPAALMSPDVICPMSVAHQSSKVFLPSLVSFFSTFARVLAMTSSNCGAAVVVVTHTISAAARHADRVVFFERGGPRGEGVVTSGPPAEVFAHPLFSRHFGTPELAGAQ